MSQFFGRRAFSVLALLVVLSTLVACAAPAVAPAAGQAAPAQKVKVTYWAHNFPPRVELDKKYIEQFMKDNPNIEVDYQIIPADFDTKINTSLAAGTGPDLFAQWNGFTGQFFEQGVIAPVNFEAIGFNSQQEFLDLYASPTVLDGAIFEGKLYGIPNEVSIYACYVNKKMFADAGLDADKDFPTTWEDMLTISQKLVKYDKDGKLVQAGFDFDYSNSVWMYLEWGAMVRQLGGSELKLETPEAEKVMQYWVDWVNKYKLGGPAFSTDQAGDFTTGKAAIKCALGSWAKPLADAAKINNAPLEYTVKKVPMWADAKNKIHFDNYAYFHLVNAKAAPEVQAAAWKLAYALDSHAVDYMVNTGLMQPRKDLVESKEFQAIPYMNIFLEESLVSQYSPRVVQWTEVADALKRMRDRCIVEGQDIKQSLATAQKEIDEIMAKKSQ